MATTVEIEEPQISPNVTEMDDGSIVLGEIQETQAPISIPFDSNLAEHIEESDLNSMSSDIVAEIQEDINSRKEWEDQYKNGL